MQNAATRRGTLSRGWQNPIILYAALLIINPVGLWLTWTQRSLNRQTKLLLSAVSVLWYLGVAGFVFALTHHYAAGPALHLYRLLVGGAYGNHYEVAAAVKAA